MQKCRCMCDSLLSLRKMKRNVWPEAQREERWRLSQKVERRRRMSLNDGFLYEKLQRTEEVIETKALRHL